MGRQVAAPDPRGQARGLVRARTRGPYTPPGLAPLDRSFGWGWPVGVAGQRAASLRSTLFYAGCRRLAGLAAPLVGVGRLCGRAVPMHPACSFHLGIFRSSRFRRGRRWPGVPVARPRLGRLSSWGSRRLHWFAAFAPVVYGVVPLRIMVRCCTHACSDFASSSWFALAWCAGCLHKGHPVGVFAPRAPL